MNAIIPRFIVLSSCGLLAVLQLGGCFSARTDCDRNPMLRCGIWSVDDSGTGGNGGAGGGAATPPGCVPATADGPVDATCGVFVSATHANAQPDGSPDRPYGSLQAAIDVGETGPIYLCGEDFGAASATITLPAGRDVFGGLDCDDGWSYRPDVKKTILAGPPNLPAMAITGDAETVMADVTVVSPDANEAGASSIALIVDGPALKLERCELLAGKGMDGDDGGVWDKPAASGAIAFAGTGCGSGTVSTQEPPVLDCGGGHSSRGGAGGIGQNAGAGPGAQGTSNPESNSPAGDGGRAATETLTCGLGEGGVGGTNGQPSPAASGLGMIDGAGFKGVDGSLGSRGTPGQGGGGGGGGRGLTSCTPNTQSGPSGGNGGSGGCGGAGGLGGQAGGGSIALMSLGANVSLSECTLKASAAGRGGAGASGQGGGAGKNGGTGGDAPNGSACNGGRGGDGGAGGPGSGASGGHSLAIAHTGSEPTVTDSKLTFAPAAAAGGGGGVGTGGIKDADPGSAGRTGESLKF